MKYQLFSLLTAGCSLLLSATQMHATAPAKQTVKHYHALPSKQYKPDGWVKEYLHRQITGLTGHPEESGFPFDTGMWTESLDYHNRPHGGGQDWWPYEQTAYYLDGALRCGYMMQEQSLIDLVRKNINAFISHKQTNAEIHLPNVEDDSWAQVVFMRGIVEYIKNTKDQAVLDAVATHYKTTYNANKAVRTNKGQFKGRGFLNVELLCDLYELTDDRWFLDSAEALYKKFQGTSKKASSISARGMLLGVKPGGHAVTYHEFLKLPAVLYAYTGKPVYKKAIENAYAMLEKHHMLSDGLSSGVEHLEGREPYMAHETCNVIDFNWACGWALLATGEASYADKMEQVLYNAGMASITSDFKAHQYYGSPNLPISSNMSSWYNDKLNWGASGKTRFAYRPGHDTECCSGNIHRMLPTFINRAVMTQGREVKLNFYLPGRFTVTTSAGALVLDVQTNYPFNHQVEIEVLEAPKKSISLGLRIPNWAEQATVTDRNKTKEITPADQASYSTIKRRFREGEKLSVQLNVSPKVVPTYKGQAVTYGPLLYAYPIPYTKRVCTTDTEGKCSSEFPAYELLPDGTWAYGLSKDSEVKLIKNDQAGAYPWDEHQSPWFIQVKTKEIKNWKLEDCTLFRSYPEQPKTIGEWQEVTLEPLGSTMLRLTDFPILQ